MTWDQIDTMAAETAKLVVCARFKARDRDWRAACSVDRRVRPIFDTLTALAAIVPLLGPDGYRSGNEDTRHIAIRMVGNAYERARALIPGIDGGTA